MSLNIRDSGPPPGTNNVPLGHRWQVGDQVKYWSRSQQEWRPSVIKKVNSDALFGRVKSVDVEGRKACPVDWLQLTVVVNDFNEQSSVSYSTDINQHLKNDDGPSNSLSLFDCVRSTSSRPNMHTNTQARPILQRTVVSGSSSFAARAAAVSDAPMRILRNTNSSSNKKERGSSICRINASGHHFVIALLAMTEADIQQIPSRAERETGPDDIDEKFDDEHHMCNSLIPKARAEMFANIHTDWEEAQHLQNIDDATKKERFLEDIDLRWKPPKGVVDTDEAASLDPNGWEIVTLKTARHMYMDHGMLVLFKPVDKNEPAVTALMWSKPIDGSNEKDWFFYIRENYAVSLLRNGKNTKADCTVIGYITTHLRVGQRLKVGGGPAPALMDMLLQGKTNHPPPQKLRASSTCPPDIELNPPAIKLNESQTQAVDLTQQRKSLVLIQGPPGTGKTLTAAAILQKTDQRVLVCAPSNGAVKEICGRLMRVDPNNIVRAAWLAKPERAGIEFTADGRMDEQPGAADANLTVRFQRFQAITQRWGHCGSCRRMITQPLETIVEQQWENIKNKQVNFDGFMHFLKQDLQNHAKQAELDSKMFGRCMLHQMPFGDEQSVAVLDSISAMPTNIFDDIECRDWDRLRDRASMQPLLIAETIRENLLSVQDHRDFCAEFEHNLRYMKIHWASLKDVNLAIEWITSDRTAKLTESQFDRLVEAFPADVQRSGRPDEISVYDFLDALSEKSQAKRFLDLLEDCDLSICIKQAIKRNVNLQFFVFDKMCMHSDFEWELDFQKSALEHAQFIFCTLSVSYNPIVQEVAFGDIRIVMIDEAGQAVLPESLLPLHGTAERLWIIGDPKQLPATVISEAAKRKGYDRSLFEHFQKLDMRSHMLNTQYRMHPQISRWPSQRFYEDKLKDGVVFDPDGESHVVWYDTSCFPLTQVLERQPGKNEKKSWQNPKEAQLIIKRLEDEWASGFLFRILGDEGRVGIIAGYKGQVRLLQRMIFEDHLLPEDVRDRIDVRTVDGFQGQEREIIIFSAVRANSKGNIGFLHDRRRLNVALTRAKKYLLIFAHKDTFKQQIDSADWQSLLHHCRDHDYIQDVDPDARVTKIARSSTASASVAAMQKDLPAIWTILSDESFTHFLTELDASKRAQFTEGMMMRLSKGICTGIIAPLFAKAPDVLTIELPIGKDILFVSIVLNETTQEQQIKIWGASKKGDELALRNRVDIFWGTRHQDYKDRCLERGRMNKVSKVVSPNVYAHRCAERNEQLELVTLGGDAALSTSRVHKFGDRELEKLMDPSLELDGVQFPIMLNAEQEAALLAALIIGRAGTGKTEVLFAKTCRFLQSWIAREDKLSGACVFITRSPPLWRRLCGLWQQTLEGMAFSNSNRIFDLTGMCDEEDITNAMSELPKDFSRVQGHGDATWQLVERFPVLFLTMDSFMDMIARQLGEGNFQMQNQINHGRFEEDYWPRMKNELGSEKNISSVLVFKEIMSVIKGSTRALFKQGAPLTRDQYVDSDADLRDSIFQRDGNKRTLVYRVFEKYQELRKKSVFAGQWDFPDRLLVLVTAYKRIGWPEGAVQYDALMVDECQDLMPSFFQLCKMVCPNVPQWTLAADTAQTINPDTHWRFPSMKAFLSDLMEEDRDELEQSRQFVPDPSQLVINYRNDRGVTDLQAAIIHVMVTLFPEQVDKLEPEQAQRSHGKLPMLCLSDNPLTYELKGKRFALAANQVIEVLNPQDIEVFKAAVRQVDTNGMLFTPVGIKGLQFKDVLLYDLLGSLERQVPKEFWSVIDPTDLSVVKDKMFDRTAFGMVLETLKSIYVAISRAEERVMWFENKNGRSVQWFLKFFQARQVVLVTYNGNLHKDIERTSSAQDWLEQAQKLFEQKLYSEAARNFELGGDKCASVYSKATHHRTSALKQENNHGEFKLAAVYELAGNLYLECMDHKVSTLIPYVMAKEKAALSFADAGRCIHDGQKKRHDYYQKSATLYVELGQFSEAAASYEQAKKMKLAAENWGKAKEFSNEARCWEETKNFENARDAWKKANDFVKAGDCQKKLLPDQNQINQEKNKQKKQKMQKQMEQCYADAAKLYERGKSYQNSAECWLGAKEFKAAAEQFRLANCFIRSATAWLECAPPRIEKHALPDFARCGDPRGYHQGLELVEKSFKKKTVLTDDQLRFLFSVAHAIKKRHPEHYDPVGMDYSSLLESQREVRNSWKKHDRKDLLETVKRVGILLFKHGGQQKHFELFHCLGWQSLLPAVHADLGKIRDDDGLFLWGSEYKLWTLGKFEQDAARLFTEAERSASQSHGSLRDAWQLVANIRNADHLQKACTKLEKINLPKKISRDFLHIADMLRDLSAMTVTIVLREHIEGKEMRTQWDIYPVCLSEWIKNSITDDLTLTKPATNYFTIKRITQDRRNITLGFAAVLQQRLNRIACKFVRPLKDTYEWIVKHQWPRRKDEGVIRALLGASQDSSKDSNPFVWRVGGQQISNWSRSTTFPARELEPIERMEAVVEIINHLCGGGVKDYHGIRFHESHENKCGAVSLSSPARLNAMLLQLWSFGGAITVKDAKRRLEDAKRMLNDVRFDQIRHVIHLEELSHVNQLNDLEGHATTVFTSKHPLAEVKVKRLISHPALNGKTGVLYGCEDSMYQQRFEVRAISDEPVIVPAECLEIVENSAPLVDHLGSLARAFCRRERPEWHEAFGWRQQEIKKAWDKVHQATATHTSLINVEKLLMKMLTDFMSEFNTAHDTIRANAMFNEAKLHECSVQMNKLLHRYVEDNTLEEKEEESPDSASESDASSTHSIQFATTAAGIPALFTFAKKAIQELESRGLPVK